VCVGAKANVLHCVGFERWDAALLILQKRWHFVFHFSVRLLSVVLSFRVRHNGWGCDQFGGAGLGIYPTLKPFLRADPLT
jgi:hypothetical protein